MCVEGKDWRRVERRDWSPRGKVPELDEFMSLLCVTEEPRHPQILTNEPATFQLGRHAQGCIRSSEYWAASPALLLTAP